MKEEKVRALFLLANIDVKGLAEIPNEYWPETERYADLRAEDKWWLVETAAGTIKFGPRKRVFLIDWSATPIRAAVTQDDVTKAETMVHAWSYWKALEYLCALRRHM